MKLSKHSSLFQKNLGKPGVVYVLENSSLKNGLYKVGQSTRSGSARARDLNRQASTGMPANYRCIFEYRTVDCGRAERAVHRRLEPYRKGKWGQEFFEAPLEKLKSIIAEECDQLSSQAHTGVSRKVFDAVLRMPSKPIINKTNTLNENRDSSQASRSKETDDSMLEKLGSWSISLTLIFLTIWIIKSCSR